MKASLLLLAFISLPTFAQVILDHSEVILPSQDVILVRTSATPQKVKLLRDEEVFKTVCLESKTETVTSKHPSCGSYSYVADRCSNGQFPDSGCGSDGYAYNTIETDYYECKHEEVKCVKEEKISQGLQRFTYWIEFYKLPPLPQGVTEEFLVSKKKVRVMRGTRRYKTDYFGYTFYVEKKSFLGF